MGDSGLSPAAERTGITAMLSHTLPYFAVRRGATSPIPPALVQACRTPFVWKPPPARFVWNPPRTG